MTRESPKIKWAGYDGLEVRAYHDRKVKTMRELFQRGLDTREIAYRVRLPESDVYNAMAKTREVDRRG